MEGKFELKENELKQVIGGGSGSYDGTSFKDGDVYALRSTDLSSSVLDVMVLKNCGPQTCDIDAYIYIRNTGTFVYLNPLYTNLKYSNILNNYVKVNDITFSN